jgi:hypothetical protein
MKTLSHLLLIVSFTVAGCAMQQAEGGEEEIPATASSTEALGFNHGYDEFATTCVANGGTVEMWANNFRVCCFTTPRGARVCSNHPEAVPYDARVAGAKSAQ